MLFLFKKDYNLVRYFILIGIAAFAAYIITNGYSLLLVLLGPSIHAAHAVKNFLTTYLGMASLFEAVPVHTVNDFFFLMPVILLYFGGLGFLMTQLQKEQGLTRYFSVFALLIFLGCIHFWAWSDLARYFLPNS